VQPETNYARSGELHIAYQIVGEGPRDLVFVPGFVSHLDLDWENPARARFIERLASFAREPLVVCRLVHATSRRPDRVVRICRFGAKKPLSH
jgi:hypothetical protein